MLFIIYNKTYILNNLISSMAITKKPAYNFLQEELQDEVLEVEVPNIPHAELIAFPFAPKMETPEPYVVVPEDIPETPALTPGRLLSDYFGSTHNPDEFLFKILGTHLKKSTRQLMERSEPAPLFLSDNRYKHEKGYAKQGMQPEGWLGVQMQIYEALASRLKAKPSPTDPERKQMVKEAFGKAFRSYDGFKTQYARATESYFTVFETEWKTTLEAVGKPDAPRLALDLLKLGVDWKAKSLYEK